MYLRSIYANGVNSYFSFYPHSLLLTVSTMGFIQTFKFRILKITRFYNNFFLYLTPLQDAVSKIHILNPYNINFKSFKFQKYIKMYKNFCPLYNFFKGVIFKNPFLVHHRYRYEYKELLCKFTHINIGLCMLIRI